MSWPIAPSRKSSHQASEHFRGDGDGVRGPPCYKLQTELSEAAREGRVDRVKELLRLGANAGGTAGDSIPPLQEAAAEGNLEAALLLLNNGADVNLGDGIRGWALTWAIEGGHADIVELLLSRGANPTLGQKETRWSSPGSGVISKSLR